MQMKNLLENSFFPPDCCHQKNVSGCLETGQKVERIEHISSLFSSGTSKVTSAIKNNNIRKNIIYKGIHGFSSSKDKNDFKQNNNGSVEQKYNLQQVSSLYSQHIYKSNQKDYFNEAQLQKYKLMLSNQKKQKMKLLYQKNQWSIEKAKLLEQRNVILFALDSMTVKLESDFNPKKSKQLRRQTAEILKQKFYPQVLKKQYKNQVRYKTDPPQAAQKWEPNQTENFEIGQRIKHIRNTRQNISSKQNTSSQIDQMFNSYQQAQVKIKQLELRCQDYQQKITQLENKNKQLELKNGKLQQAVELKNKQNQLVIVQKSQIVNEKILIQQNLNSLATQKNIVQQQLTQMKKVNQNLTQKLKYLQKQLKYTKQQYQFRQQKQKQCVKLLQKFSKDLKLSDQKIKDFLKQQLSSYMDEGDTGLNRSKKTYNEHLSYILHLCKKKQALYQNLVQEFKQRMKQDDFLVSILQKKLSGFTQYQQKLRQLVERDSDRDTIVRTIIRFGY